MYSSPRVSRSQLERTLSRRSWWKRSAAPAAQSMKAMQSVRPTTPPATHRPLATGKRIRSGVCACNVPNEGAAEGWNVARALEGVQNVVVEQQRVEAAVDPDTPQRDDGIAPQVGVHEPAARHLVCQALTQQVASSLEPPELWERCQHLQASDCVARYV